MEASAHQDVAGAHRAPAVPEDQLGGAAAFAQRLGKPEQRRTAAIAADKTLLTTVQELAAAVQAIEAMRAGDLGVTSLQEHARELDLYSRTDVQ